MTAAAVIVIAACIAAACVQRRTRQPRRPDAQDYAEHEERMMRAAAKAREEHHEQCPRRRRLRVRFRRQHRVSPAHRAQPQSVKNARGVCAFSFSVPERRGMSENKTLIHGVRFTPAELAALRSMAEDRSCSVGAVVRWAVRKAVIEKCCATQEVTGPDAPDIKIAFTGE